MHKSEKAFLTALCMVYDGSRVLLQNRVKEDWAGVTFPGGHVEKGESFVKAVQREILEETGLRIQKPRLCGIKQFQTQADERYVVLFFKTGQFSGELCSSDEGEMLWVERDDIQNHALVPDFFKMLRVFDEDDLSELIYEPAAPEGWTAKLY